CSTACKSTRARDPCAARACTEPSHKLRSNRPACARSRWTPIARVITSIAVLEDATLGHLQDALSRVAQLEAALAQRDATLAQVTAERDKLRHAYEQLKEHLELLRRRIFLAKAERIDISQLEMEFAQTRAKLDALAMQVGTDAVNQDATAAADTPPGAPPTSRQRAKPTGRRNLADCDLPEERVEILDPALDSVAERIGFEESSKVKYRRGGMVRVVVARATYKSAVQGAPSTSEDAAMVELYT